MIASRTPLPRSINRVLARTVGVRVTPASRRPVYLSKAWFARLIHFHRLIEQIAGVPGDVVECGVADGASLATLCSLLIAHGQKRELWGFDSWAGLPAPAGPDLGARSVAAGGMFAAASTARVREELLAYGICEAEISTRVRLVPGLFSHTLPNFQRPIALLHIDVDLYQSYLDCLGNLWPRVQAGGVVAFDEYGEPDTWPGARRAVDEFFAAHAADASELRLDESSGKWWLMKRA
jgi:O-methyltransferase